ncbi:hypothetical protein [Bacillus gaemokensis]|uniref:Uncharacterized protein n=1 Tax=Bacillus gaemokensis TaxID=574375 RepID=A0A073KFE1_9BACI|nr:hypothetical protein [Bacillus gaemokensis]KEK25167.1 hypothetical protein BAGA_11035 [Bacillus gaemokensis]KYG37390.1 hypothetical protein AZF08_08270 [Bacillus gaemokensis]
MANTTNIIQENIDKAREIKKGTTSFMSGLMNEFYRPERNAIEMDKMLTYEGKKEKAKKLSDKYEVAFMREMQKRRDEYEALLQEAKLEAEKVLIATAPKVEEHTQKLFDLKAGKVKSAVMFASSSTSAIKSLEQLVSAEKEPALAQQALASFMDMSQQVLELTPAGQKVAIRKQLGDMYKRLEGQSEVGDATGARAAIQDIESLAGAPFAIGFIQKAAAEISEDTAKYMNEPSRYFEEKTGFVQEVESVRTR